MTKISASEARIRFGELLQRAESGEEIVITRHDRPVDSVKRTVEGLPQLQQRIRKRSRGRSGVKCVLRLET